MSDTDKLVEFLKGTQESRVSVSGSSGSSGYKSKWVSWDATHNEWLVVERAFYAKDNKELYRGDNLGKAIEALKGDA